MGRPPSSASNRVRLPAWVIVAIFLAVGAVSWWQTRPPVANPDFPVVTPGPHKSSPSEDDERRHPSNAPISVEITPESSTRSSEPSVKITPDRGVLPGRKSPGEATVQFKDQTIRDQNGKVLFRGTIDLQPTLDRIASGGRKSHRNDGTTFQNRERRLPAKPSGYYKEYVHPTPGSSGPGPQRVIVGKDGDIWYTPDHYNSFQKVR